MSCESDNRGFKSLYRRRWRLCFAWLALCVAGWTQAPPPVPSTPPALPDEPAAVQPAPAKPIPGEGPTVHAFWDKTNLYLFAGIGIMRGLDYASTRNMQARGREEILLPDDVVNNSAGFAALEAAASMTSVGLSYVLHRTGHHSLERWLSIGHISVAGFGVVRNYCLESHHPLPAPPASGARRR